MSEERLRMCFVRSANISVMSSNLLTTTRFPIVYTEMNMDRGELFRKMMEDNNPDSAGLCEVTQEWLDYIVEFCNSSEVFGVTGTRRSYKPGEGPLRSGSGEYVAIMYRKDRFECIDDGGWWYSTTPDVPSRFEIPGHDAMKYDRVFSYGVFKEKETGITYIHMNVHFDHKSDDYTNALCSKLTTEKGKELAKRFGGAPVIVTGDFNCEEDTEAYRFLANPENGFFDTKYKAAKMNPLPTFIWTLGDYKPEEKPGKIIDFVFGTVGNVKALESDVITEPHFSVHYAAISKIIVENAD